MTTVGIIGAMDNEIEILKVKYNLSKDKKNKEIYVNEINDKRIVVAQSGVGKVNSAAMSQYIIDNYNVDAIINSGCAGALTNQLSIMDIVIGESATYYDFNPIEIMRSYVPDNGEVKSNNVLIDIAKKTIKKMNITNSYIGRLATGDNFVNDEELKIQIMLRTGAISVDMESASISHVCSMNNIPFLPIRTISDFADGGEYQEEMAAYKSSQFVTEMVSELFKYLDNREYETNKCLLYVPKLTELDYYKEVLCDEKTMNYNSGYDLQLNGYDNNTGCIKSFEIEKWYKRQMIDKNRYFAYILDKNTNKPVGYVNFHFDEQFMSHSMGIIIEHKYRNKGFGTDALKLLLDVAFNKYNLESLIDTIPYNRSSALKLLTKSGFVDMKKDFYLKKFGQRERIIVLELTRNRYNTIK